MATEVIMPQLGLTMTEGTVDQWVKQEGDVVKKGDVLLTITTDKLVSDIESEVDGVLRKICAREGEEVPVKGLLAIVGEQDEVLTIQKDIPTVDNSVVVLEVVKPTADTNMEVGQEMKRIKASPLAKKTAAKLGKDLAFITGTGIGGRIIQRDVLSHKNNITISKQPGKVNEEKAFMSTVDLLKEEHKKKPFEEDLDIIKPLTSMRKVIGKRMTESKHNAPHVTLTTEANVDKAVALRNKLNQKTGDVRLSYTDLLVKMVAGALRHVPMINASIEEDRIVIKDKINIGVAVALDEGLVVPVVKDADRKGLKAISQEVKELADKARNNKLSSNELSGGTFTISNLGNYDIDAFTPIINLPESAILGVGRIVRKPIVNEKDEIVPASMMALSLSFDHRVVDGALAAQLLKKIKGYLEDPDTMYL